MMHLTNKKEQLLGLQLIYLLFGSIEAGNPWEPEPKFNNSHWTAKHKSFLTTTKNNVENPIKILFLGDSLTELWGFDGYGISVWNTTFVPRGGANYGIGGDRTEHVLWRILNGEIEGLTPEAVVLLIGGNNFFNKNTAVDIEKGIKEIIKTLQQKLPESKILLLGLLPVLNTDLAFKIIVDMNLRLSRLENGSKVRFLDMWHKFAQYWPSVVPELYSKDLVHISTAGYQMWADTMIPLLEKMISKKESSSVN